MTTVLEAINLEKRFGGIIATNNVCLKVEKGARLALIGPNGAGKTTLVNLLTGVLRPRPPARSPSKAGTSAASSPTSGSISAWLVLLDQSIIRRSYACRDNRTRGL